MVLQSFVLPNEVCSEKSIYFRNIGDVELNNSSESLLLSSGSSVSSDTYMNLLDVSFWTKNTRLSECSLYLTLEGSGCIEIWRWNEGKRNKEYSRKYCCTGSEKIKIPINLLEGGMVFFVICADRTTTLYEAYYSTKCKLKDIKLTLIICTYKREHHLIQNICKLLQSQFFDENSYLYHKLFIRVVDNASKINLGKSENLQVHHNKNTGGSGGFIKGITETQKAEAEFSSTHIMFMDDDVEFLLESFYRIYAILSLIKDEMKDEMIAGRMFRLDDRCIQYTASEIWNKGDIRHVGGGLDVRNLCNLEKINEQRGEYSGWWMAVFPYRFTVNNLPIPFFLHCDDVEYGLRKGGSPIVLNGVQVWHETYEYRCSPIISYYDMRNSLIVNSMYEDSSYMLIKRVRWKNAVLEARQKQDYLLEYMNIRAMLDYLKGNRWLYSIDSEKLHKKICSKRAYKLVNKLLWLEVCFKLLLNDKKKNIYELRRKGEKMKQKPYVSIIVPIYNVEKFLKECLDSVVNQTLKNIEIICVNDGSTDQSLKILEEYAKSDERVKIISKQNSGYGNTMNMGIASATGEYIGIVESDDYVEENMFERLYATACEYDAEIVKSDHYIFSTKEGKKQKQFQAVCPQQFYNQIVNANTCSELFNFCMMNWTGIYKTEFIRKNKIVHNETPGASFQDNGFWFQTMAMAEKIVFINEAFYYYRQDNPDSSINRKEKVFCICEEYNYIQKFVEANEKVKSELYVKFFTKKVFNYLHFYEKAADEFKIDFLRRIADEFALDLKNPAIDKEKVNTWVMSMVNRIIDSPELFYYEDSTWKLREEKNRVHQLLLDIRNSKEFQSGLKIKRLLHMKM